MPLEVVSAATIEPVTTGEAKGQLRVDGDDDNARIERLIRTAREWVEHETQRRLVTQTWRQHWDCFPDELRLGLAPVATVTSVKYYDLDNALQTLSSALYQADLVTTPARIHPVDGESWPDTYVRYNAVQVNFTVGASAARSRAWSRKRSSCGSRAFTTASTTSRPAATC